jgi:hypothetical protein
MGSGNRVEEVVGCGGGGGGAGGRHFLGLGRRCVGVLCDIYVLWILFQKKKSFELGCGNQQNMINCKVT